MFYRSSKVGDALNPIYNQFVESKSVCYTQYTRLLSNTHEINKKNIRNCDRKNNTKRKTHVACTCCKTFTLYVFFSFENSSHIFQTL